MKLDLAFDYILLATSNLRHIDPYCFGNCAEVGGIPDDVRDPGAPDLILGGQTGHRWARATDPTARSTTATLLPLRAEC